MVSLVLCCAFLVSDPEAEKPKVDAYWGLKALFMDAKAQATYTKSSGRPCPIKTGVAVYNVAEDGPAKKAGVLTLDVIVAVDKNPIKSYEDLEKIFAASKTGQTVVLDIRRMQKKNPANSANANYRRGSKSPAPLVTWEKVECKLIVGSQAEMRAAIEAEKKAGPLKIVGALITHNSIGTPVLAVRTVAREDIEAYEIEADAFDKFDEPVKNWGFGKNEHTAMSQKTMAKGTDATQMWTMHGADGVGVFKCKLLRVKLADGTIWKPEEGTLMTFKAPLERN